MSNYCGSPETEALYRGEKDARTEMCFIVTGDVGTIGEAQGGGWSPSEYHSPDGRQEIFSRGGSMTDELLEKARDFAATDPQIIAAAPMWVQRLYAWSKEEAKKTV